MSFNATAPSSMGSSDGSLSALLGYHDSPSNKPVSSIYTRRQLRALISDDAVLDPMANNSLFLPAGFYGSGFGGGYKAGTEHNTTPVGKSVIEQVNSFIAETEKSSPDPRSYIRNYHRVKQIVTDGLSSSALNLSSASDRTHPHLETDASKILKRYGVHAGEVEACKVKLRVWMCNTIFRPLVEKIDELNHLLHEKYASYGLHIGVSSSDALRSALHSKPELRHTQLQFVLPYLQVHPNQNYLIQRLRTLAENIILEGFNWRGGAEEVIDHVARRGVKKTVPWSARLPTDSEIVWAFFCHYMDYSLSPAPASSRGELLKPFSTVYFAASDKAPPAISEKELDTSQATLDHSQPLSEAFYVRLAEKTPPVSVFELVVDGGAEVMVPCKEEGNLWLVLLLFLWHTKYYNRGRISHLHLSTLSLDKVIE